MTRNLILLLSALLLSPMVMAAAPQASPALQLPGIEGQVDLAQQKGKVVYLDFWASWCKPCKESFPWMVDLKKRHAGDEFEIIAVNLDSEREAADEFLTHFDVNFLVGFDPEGVTAERFEVAGMPSSYLIGKDGRVYASHIGFRERDKVKFEAAIQKLLTVD